jgi:hypothetical protein
MERSCVFVEKNLHYEMKKIALNEGATVKELYENAIKEFLKQKNRKMK